MTVPARVNIVTLGVRDIVAATKFYQQLGWRKSEQASAEEITFLTLDNLVLGLYGSQALIEDAYGEKTGKPAQPPGGFTLAINLGGTKQVDDALAHAVSCGATLVKPAQKVFWGGYSGYFADPDGVLWEVAHNPFFEFEDDGRLRLPG